VEKVERYKTAQLAREIELALPIELTQSQNISLVREYVRDNFVDEGMCADICVHDKGDGNPHAHVMLTMRAIDDNGNWMNKSASINRQKVPTVDWNEQHKAEQWRKKWAESVNEYLEKYNHEQRIDHRSYKRQGKEQIPTVHLGQETHQMEKRGIRTTLGDRNRKINEINNELRQLKVRSRKLKDELFAFPIEDTAPSMTDVVTFSKGWGETATKWQKIKHLKEMVATHNFLIEHNIYDFTAFVEKAESMYHQTYGLAEEVKKVDRRLGTLEKHLEMVDTLESTRKYFKKYKTLSGKDKISYAEKYKSKLQAYTEARNYFKNVLNGRTEIPSAKWQKEQKSLVGERVNLLEQYYNMRGTIKDAEMVKRRIVSTMERLEIAEKSPHETLKSSADKMQNPKPQEKKLSIREKLALAKLKVAGQNTESSRSSVEKNGWER
ncbi:MAG: MobA/MobL family protein, partial [Oscillospiraceae bacterium]|nr:MobA/MobL family protein [Oscillospiraceae bacterium]